MLRGPKSFPELTAQSRWRWAPELYHRLVPAVTGCGVANIQLVCHDAVINAACPTPRPDGGATFGTIV